MVRFHSPLTPPPFPAPPSYGEHPAGALNEPRNPLCAGELGHVGSGRTELPGGYVEGLTNAAVGPAYVLQAEALVHV